MTQAFTDMQHSCPKNISGLKNQVLRSLKRHWAFGHSADKVSQCNKTFGRASLESDSVHLPFAFTLAACLHLMTMAKMSKPSAVNWSSLMHIIMSTSWASSILNYYTCKHAWKTCLCIHCQRRVQWSSETWPFLCGGVCWGYCEGDETFLAETSLLQASVLSRQGSTCLLICFRRAPYRASLCCYSLQLKSDWEALWWSITLSSSCQLSELSNVHLWAKCPSWFPETSVRCSQSRRIVNQTPRWIKDVRRNKESPLGVKPQPPLKYGHRDREKFCRIQTESRVAVMKVLFRFASPLQTCGRFLDVHLSL